MMTVFSFLFCVKKIQLTQICRFTSRTQQSVVTILASISKLTIQSVVLLQFSSRSRHQWFSKFCVCRRLFSCS